MIGDNILAVHLSGSHGRVTDLGIKIYYDIEIYGTDGKPGLLKPTIHPLEDEHHSDKQMAGCTKAKVVFRRYLQGCICASSRSWMC